MNIIKDGTGSGNTAKVDDHGRLWVASSTVDHKQHHALYHKNLYIIDFDLTLSGATETPFAFFKNLDGTKDFEVYTVYISSNADVQVDWRLGDEYDSGGTIVQPCNSNRGSGLTISTAQAKIYEGGAAADLSLTTTNGVRFSTAYIGANTQQRIDFDGCLVLTNDTTASMTVTGATGNKVTMTVMLAYHTAGTKL